MDPSTLPLQLPPGRLRTAGPTGFWLSDKPVAAPSDLWAHCQQEQEATGWRPVLIARPWEPGEVFSTEDERHSFNLETELVTSWRSYRDMRARLAAEPADYADVPEGVEPPAHDPGPPFEEWPGLARAGVGGADPDESAHTAVRRMADSSQAPDDLRLGLVHATRSADIPSVMGWAAEAPHRLLRALLHSWEDRFGARVIAFDGAQVYVSVARPPGDERHAAHIGLEHVLSTADNVNWTPFPEYAPDLVNRRVWSFWWD